MKSRISKYAQSPKTTRAAQKKNKKGRRFGRGSSPYRMA